MPPTFQSPSPPVAIGLFPPQGDPALTTWPVHGRISGPIVMIGFGSIGQGTLPLIERHFEFDKQPLRGDRSSGQATAHCSTSAESASSSRRSRGTITATCSRPCSRQAAARASASTYRSIPPRSTSCGSAGRSARSTSTRWTSLGPASISTSKGPAARTNYALRETMLRSAAATRAAPTAVSCCGANPGMVSWFVKQALLDIARRSPA